MSSNSMLDIFEGVSFDESIVKYEFHPYLPYSSTTYQYNDEIRINLNKTDVYTLPCESFLYLEGEFSTEDDTKVSFLTNNSYAFLFSEIRYEVNSVELDRVRNPGITSTLKGLASFNESESKIFQMAGWHVGTNSTATLHTKNVNACIPLRYLLGFFEDYKRILVNCKQELILLRSRNDNNLYKGDKSLFKLNKLHWFVPHVLVSDEIKLQIYKNMEKDIFIAFRRWYLHDQPSLK